MSSTIAHTPASRPQWWIVFVAGVLTLICGTIGVAQYEHAHHPDSPVTISTYLGAAYAAVQMLVLHAPHYEDDANAWLEVGRWLGVFTLATTTWLLVWNRLQHEFRLFRLSWWRNHYVICGLGDKGMAILECILARDKSARIVVIDPTPGEDFADDCYRKDVCLIRKDAADPTVLDEARVNHAAEIVAITSSDEINLRIAAEVRNLRRDNGLNQVVCRVHLASSYLPEAFQTLMDKQQNTDKAHDSKTTLRFFDVFDNEARRVLLGLPHTRQADEAMGSVPIDGPGMRASDVAGVRVVIVGLGRMGISIALRAAKMGHFANKKQLRISVIDRSASLRKQQLFFRYPILAEKNEICEMNFYDLEADSIEVRRLIETWSSETQTLVHLFICLDNNARAGEVGLRFWGIIERRENCHLNIRIKSKASLAPILELTNPRLKVFGMVEDTCTEDAFRGEQNEAYAKIIHQNFVQERRKEQGNEGNIALVDWDNLRDDFRESNRQQADHIAIKMSAIGCKIVDATKPGEAVIAFTTDEIEILAELEHRRWNAERWLAGWRYGAVSDKPRRINQWLVPWDNLDPKIKEYDRETIRKIPELLSQVQPAKKVVRETA